MRPLWVGSYWQVVLEPPEWQSWRGSDPRLLCRLFERSLRIQIFWAATLDPIDRLGKSSVCVWRKGESIISSSQMVACCRSKPVKSERQKYSDQHTISTQLIRCYALSSCTRSIQIMGCLWGISWDVPDNIGYISAKTLQTSYNLNTSCARAVFKIVTVWQPPTLRAGIFLTIFLVLVCF